MNAPTVAAILGKLANTKANGEFVVATQTREFHVYFCEGRVAWATDSSQPAHFSRLIRSQCAINEPTWSSVIEECRRSRMPLGETLVSLGLAQTEEVRAAIAAQARAVFDTLASLGAASTIFLDRPSFRTYRVEFTFDLAELLLALPPPEPSRTYLRSPTPIPERVDGAAWVSLLRRGIASPVQGVAPSRLDEIGRALARQEFRFIGLRTNDASMVGTVMSTDESLWCGGGTAGSLPMLASAILSLGVPDEPNEWPPLASHQIARTSGRAVDLVLSEALALGNGAFLAVSVETASCSGEMGRLLPEQLATMKSRGATLCDFVTECLGQPSIDVRAIFLHRSFALFFHRSPSLSVWVVGSPTTYLGLGMAALSIIQRSGLGITP